MRMPVLENFRLENEDCTKIIRFLQNDLSAKNISNLLQTYPQYKVMFASVTGEQGQPLTEIGLALVNECCVRVENLKKFAMDLLDYLENKIQIMGKNLSKVLDDSTAAKLLIAAGGLKMLSELPVSKICLLLEYVKKHEVVYPVIDSDLIRDDSNTKFSADDISFFEKIVLSAKADYQYPQSV